MRAARMHGYRQPLVFEDVKVPDIASDQVLVKVGATGMCRSDVQLIDGYFSEALKLRFPITPGHEIAGSVAAIGDRVPQATGLAVGDQVVVAAGWGDGLCRQCRLRATQCRRADVMVHLDHGDHALPPGEFNRRSDQRPGTRV